MAEQGDLFEVQGSYFKRKSSYGGDMTTFCIESQYENHNSEHSYLLWYIQANLDVRNFIFPFLNRELFDSGKIYVLNLKTGRPKDQKKCLM